MLLCFATFAAASFILDLTERANKWSSASIVLEPMGRQHVGQINRVTISKIVYNFYEGIT